MTVPGDLVFYFSPTSYSPPDRCYLAFVICGSQYNSFVTAYNCGHSIRRIVSFIHRGVLWRVGS